MYLLGRGLPVNKTKACESFRSGSSVGDEASSKNFRRNCRFH
jgi:hypothetical protein